MPSFSVATLNVKAGGFAGYSDMAEAPGRLSAIQAAVASIGASVIGLVDTFRWHDIYTPERLHELFSNYPNVFHTDMDCEVVDPRIGLTILGNESLVGCKSVRIYDRNCLRADIQVGGQEMQLYIVYLTSFSGERRRKQIQALLKYIDAQPEMPTLIMGDFNTIRPENLIWPARLLGKILPPSHRTGTGTGRLSEVLALTQTDVVSLLRESGFKDEMEKQPSPTFHARSGGMKIELAVDYCFTRGLQAARCGVLQGSVYRAASDHYPVKLTIR